MSLCDRMVSTVSWMLLESCASVRYAWPTTSVTARVHLNPGQGNIAFAVLFQRLELSGYRHHDMMAFGSLEEKLAGCDYLTACWPEC